MANQTLQLARLLREDGATVDVIQVNAPYSPRWIGRLKGIRAGFRLIPYLARLWRSSSRVDLYHIMANSGWSWHLFAAPAIWMAKIAGKPVIVNYRGGEAEAFFDKALAWVKPTMDQADAIIVSSDFLGAVFGKRGWHARIVPNIIDMDRFGAAPRPVSASPLAPRILVARNLEPIYDNETALRAFRIVKRSFPAARLVIAGSGPLRKALEMLTAELGVKRDVTFAGRVENDDMAKLYREADLVVNPSLADNMPISILEALACGVPVVSTNVGGIPKLVEHDKTAVLVPPQRPEEMANAILAVLSDPVKASRLRAAGTESVCQYTWPKVRLRLLDVYQDVLARKGRLAIKTK